MSNPYASFSCSQDSDVPRLIDYIYPRFWLPKDIRIYECFIDYYSWDSLSKEHPRCLLFEVLMGQSWGIYNWSNLHEPLTKHDSLLDLMDRMGPHAQLWACMGCGNINFPNNVYNFFFLKKKKKSIIFPKIK